VTLAAVSDAGPLIHLAEIGSLELLDTFDTLLVPETVYKEVGAGGVPDGLADLSYKLVEADESRVATEDLDAGERAAIAVAEERGLILLTDDLAAREEASGAGVEVRGSMTRCRSGNAGPDARKQFLTTARKSGEKGHHRKRI